MSRPADMALPIPKVILLGSQCRSRIMQLGNGSINRSLQLICCATLSLPCPFLQRQSWFVAELTVVPWVDGFGTMPQSASRNSRSSKVSPGECSSQVGKWGSFPPSRSSTDHCCRLSGSSTTAAFRSNAICQPWADFPSPTASALLYCKQPTDVESKLWYRIKILGHCCLCQL